MPKRDFMPAMIQFRNDCIEICLNPTDFSPAPINNRNAHFDVTQAVSLRWFVARQFESTRNRRKLARLRHKTLSPQGRNRVSIVEPLRVERLGRPAEARAFALTHQDPLNLLG